MIKIWLKYIIVILMIISFAIVGITSAMMDDDAGENSYENGIVFVHHASGIIFLVLIGIHLILHLNWIWAMTKKIFMKKN